MTSERRIGQLITKIQNDFLEAPGLRLAAREAEQRFGIDSRTREAIFAVLADAQVLTTDRQGAYVRNFPRASRHLAA